MDAAGILSQPFITSVDIMFLRFVGWESKDLENFPPDLIRDLIQFEMKREHSVDSFLHFLTQKQLMTKCSIAA